MEHDEIVHDVRVTESIQLGANLQPLRRKNVSFMVGTHGPFTLSYDLTEYSPQRVKADITKEVEQLRAIGALGPARS